MRRPAADRHEWDQIAPRRAPFRLSPSLIGIRATGRDVSYEQADTWYPTWGDDGHLYSQFTDGVVGGVESWSVRADHPYWVEPATQHIPTIGHAAIIGDDPLDLTIRPLGLLEGDSNPYGGRYPCASLMHDGVWYSGTYCLDDGGRGLNWDVLGPFVGFNISTDRGATWTSCPHTPSTPLFGEHAPGNDPIKFGAPRFIDFGRNMEHSPDGYAYLVGHGSDRRTEGSSWMSGDDIFLARCRPDPEGINNLEAWDFASGRDKNSQLLWTRGDVGAARPLLTWTGHMGGVAATWVPHLQRYLMCITDGWPTIKEMDSYVLEADRLDGPWRMVAFLERFGTQGYFLNLPSKFITRDDRAWLCYSANFVNNFLYPGVEADPPGDGYAMRLLEIEFIRGELNEAESGLAGQQPPA